LDRTIAICTAPSQRVNGGVLDRATKMGAQT
jgi:hypothetical protein